MKKIWHDEAWEDYLVLQNDKKLLKKTNAILKDIQRNPYDGIGKPEPLKANLAGYWSRGIKINANGIDFYPASFHKKTRVA